MSLAYLSIGSNLGEREGNCRRAIERLRRAQGIQVVAVSGLYETEPIGPRQPDFINLAAVLSTELSPHALLATLKRIETEMGRTSSIRWGPRTIDLDILMIDDVLLNDDGLTLPHPRLHERRFVLLPLAEIAPSARHPSLGQSVKELLEGLGEAAGREAAPGGGRVRRVADS